ncbi:MAG: hypothetical protein LZF86_190124 [Nitrospira sp.]|nr:MAG: hypothetical protein LZF86_190124 [Nitrospira sp.]
MESRRADTARSSAGAVPLPRRDRICPLFYSRPGICRQSSEVADRFRRTPSEAVGRTDWECGSAHRPPPGSGPQLHLRSCPPPSYQRASPGQAGFGAGEIGGGVVGLSVPFVVFGWGVGYHGTYEKYCSQSKEACRA